MKNLKLTITEFITIVSLSSVIISLSYILGISISTKLPLLQIIDFSNILSTTIHMIIPVTVVSVIPFLLGVYDAEKETESDSDNVSSKKKLYHYIFSITTLTILISLFQIRYLLSSCTVLITRIVFIVLIVLFELGYLTKIFSHISISIDKKYFLFIMLIVIMAFIAFFQGKDVGKNGKSSFISFPDTIITLQNNSNIEGKIILSTGPFLLVNYGKNKTQIINSSNITLIDSNLKQEIKN